MFYKFNISTSNIAYYGDAPRSANLIELAPDLYDSIKIIFLQRDLIKYETLDLTMFNNLTIIYLNYRTCYGRLLFKHPCIISTKRIADYQYNPLKIADIYQNAIVAEYGEYAVMVDPSMIEFWPSTKTKSSSFLHC